MSRYQLVEYRQLQDARSDIAMNNLSSSARRCSVDAITILINIMLMIDDVDDNTTFTAKEIFDTLYKDMR